MKQPESNWAIVIALGLARFGHWERTRIRARTGMIKDRERTKWHLCQSNVIQMLNELESPEIIWILEQVHERLA